MRMIIRGKLVTHTRKREIHKAFGFGKFEGRNTLRRTSRKWKNFIEIDLPEI
jgi:transposase